MKQKAPPKIAALIVVAAVTVLPIAVDCGAQPGPSSRIIPVQGKLEQPLIDFIASVPPATRVSIVVDLIPQLQLQEEEKRVLLQAITVTNQLLRMQQRRTAMVNALRTLAANSQRPLLDMLRPLETTGLVRGIRPLWLSNCIGLEATPDVIQRLASSNEVDYIHLDLPRHITLGTSSKVAQGLEQIHADQVPPSPNNEKVIVAVLDTGTDITHPDLVKSIWTNVNEIGLDSNGKKKETNKQDDDHNGRIDDVNGWNFAGPGDSDLTDLDPDGHGTPVAGVIAGDGSDGTRTGVAPHARVMVLRYDEVAPNKAREQECWDAMQYAASQGANILNFSSAFPDALSPDYPCWRRQVQNLTDAYVLFVAAAGDAVGLSIHPPFSVLVPARAPSALAVGFIGTNEPDEIVSDASPRGPVTWINVPTFNDYPDPPGLLKPDLVAPGEHVKSLKKKRGYGTFDGTSFSAPYVSGVAALILVQNLALSPYDVRFILEESAIKANDGAADVQFGWGRVDAKQALQLKFDAATPYDLVVGNVAVTNLSKLEQLKPVLLTACVTNLGGQVVGNVEMRFYFIEANPPEGQTLIIDPNGDGDLKDTPFTYIGSYFVPLVGPAKSKHESFTGVVRWTPPKIFTKLWIGVWVLPGGTSGKEANFKNNTVVTKLK